MKERIRSMKVQEMKILVMYQNDHEQYDLNGQED